MPTSMSTRSRVLSRKRTKISVFLSALLLPFAALWSVYASALSLGDFSLNSSLNEPLDASIELIQLNGLDESQVRVALASRDDFERAGIERPDFLDDIQLELEVHNENSGVIYLSSENAVVEPYLDIIVDLRWSSGRMQREYTLLLDLPVFSESPVASAPVQFPVVEVEVEVEPDPVVSSAPAQVREVQRQPEPVVEEASEDMVEEVAEESVSDSEPSLQELSQQEQELASPQVAQDSASQDFSPEVPVFDEADQGEYTVQLNDSLWEIALENRPDNSVSVQQMMLAIQRENEDAFIGDNINLVRAGQVLRIPDLNQILSLNQQEAVNEVALQNQRFSGAALDAQPLAVNNNTSVVGNVDLNDELAVITATDTQVSEGSGQDVSSTIAALEAQLMLSEENLDRAMIENQELSARFADLNAQIDLLENIIAIEDQRIAELQEELAAQAVQQNSSASVVEAPVVENQVETQIENQTSEPSALTQNPPPKTLMEQVKDSLNNTMVQLGVGLLLIALVVTFLVVRRNRVEDYDEDDFTDVYEDEDVDESQSDLEEESDEADELFEAESVADDAIDSMIDDSIDVELDDAAESDDAEEEFDNSDESDDDLGFDDDEDDSDDETRNSKILSAISGLMGRKRKSQDDDEDSLDADLEVSIEEESDEDLSLEDEAEVQEITGQEEPSASLSEDDFLSSLADEVDSSIDDKADDSFAPQSPRKSPEATLEETLNAIDELAENGEVEFSDDEVDEIEETLGELTDVAVDAGDELDTEDEPALGIDGEPGFSEGVSEDITEETAENTEEERESPAFEPVNFVLDDDEVEKLDTDSKTDSGIEDVLEAFEFNVIHDDEQEEVEEPATFTDEESGNEEEVESVDFSTSPSEMAEASASADETSDSSEPAEEGSEDEIETFDFGNLTLDDSSFEPEENDENEEDDLLFADADPVPGKLDLAVAFEAMGDLDNAKKELEEVITQGNEDQVAEAKKLLEEWNKN